MVNDGTMFIQMKLYNKISEADCLGMDGSYNLFIQKFKDNATDAGYGFYDRNFLHPIRKEPGQKLTLNETHFNNKFGSFHSSIEAQFSMLGSKFERFNNNRAALQISDIKYYNIQFRVACILTNIWRFVDKYDIEIQPHHKLWYGKGFKFPSKKNKLDLVFSNEQKSIDMVIDSEEDANDNLSKRRKATRGGQRNRQYDNSYEIEIIVGHVYTNNKYIFEVKWVGYNAMDNSWLTIDKFNDREMSHEYMATHDIQL
ncbi:hypothetical protein INT45_010130 [Circinella minor]|uniref:Chromo domain-containing protein n=1 Tax=Circinella minor TaxID=1195481 RepID=A0A8H7RD69_9FUNG|nr:hypothetical protein INT45_010130 [Circinella minor]